MSSDAESGNDDNIFYFESDHLALRGNRDYSNILRTIAMLEAQRVRVLQQLEELHATKERYLRNPELMLEKIRNGDELIAPNYLTVVKLPEIEHYKDLLAAQTAVKQEEDEEEPSISTKLLSGIRGRATNEMDSQTFNKLWSCEEQSRLEQLLIEYPVEDVEMRRFAKIAKALGNRTTKQVASRVQKYFQKLHDAGLPVPGRRPKNRRLGQVRNKHFYKPTTFFPAHNVPVNMPDDDFFTVSPTLNRQQQTAHEEHIEDTLEPITLNVQERKLQMLTAIRDEKETYDAGYDLDPMAPRCGACEVAAVSSLRWYCKSCSCYLNWCLDCLTEQLVTDNFEHINHNIVIDSDPV